MVKKDKWHMLSEIDLDNRTAGCSICDRRVGIKPRTAGRWRCKEQWLQTRVLRNRPYHKYRTDTCAKCGFIGKPCQMDIDHVDTDHSNNDPANLQTLCANCHRIKSWLERPRRPPRY